MALEPAHPLRIVHFKGTDREWGRAHGEALAEGCQKGMARFYSDFWNRIKEDGSTPRRAVLSAIELSLVPLFVRKIPSWGTDRLRGMAEGSGIAYGELARAAVLPDLLPWLQSWGIRLQPSRFTEAEPPRFGCSSFLMGGDSIVHGRNLDFPGVNYWDRFPVIEVVSRPDCLKIVNITTAGSPFPVTAMNEAGVGISLHQHYALQTSMGGQLPFVIADEVLARAHTFAQARDLLLEKRVSTSWAFVVYDASRGAVIEKTPGATGVRELGASPIAHTNFFHTSPCQSVEYAASEKMNWDNHCRHDRLLELVAGLAPTDRGGLVRALSDHYDPYWRSEKVGNRTVSQIYNIKSVLVEPGAGKICVAWGDSPVHLGEYLQYDLGELFAGRSPEPEARYPGFRFSDPKMDRAKRLFVESFVGAMDANWKDAKSALDQCLELNFFPEGAHVAGVLALKLGEWDRAREFFEKAMTWAESRWEHRPPAPEYFESALYRARTEDLAGKRGEAKKRYDWLVQHKALGPGVVRRVAERGGPFRKSHVDNLILPYATYIPFQ